MGRLISFGGRECRESQLENYWLSAKRILPTKIPLVHPSPLNSRWQAKNPWFETDVLPELKSLVAAAIA